MKNMYAFVVFLFAALTTFPGPVFAQSQPATYGTLDNFDVINDTGGDTHGFEIELEGISASDVAYTFGAPYQRYGDPTIVQTASGVIIRYSASYDAANHLWVSAVAGAPGATPYTPGYNLPSLGHSCWTGGVGTPSEYYAGGCDHFGASLNAVPTKTTYRWLVENTGAPGTLAPFGSNVSLPAPVWNVTPPAVPSGQPVAAAVIAPPASDDPTKCGDAIWAKVYTTELPNGLQSDDLDHMVIDDPNVDIVPNEPAEVEFEWVLLQACPANAGEQEFGGGAEVGAGNEAVSRRFEFYSYAGQYDPDPEAVREAMCDNPTSPDQQTAARCGDPNSDGVAGVGNMIGTQNVAINLGGIFDPPVNAPPVLSAIGNQSVDELSVLSFTAAATDADSDVLAYSLAGTVPNGASLDPDTGLFTWTPTEFQGPGLYTFDVTVSDGNGGSDSETITVAVSEMNSVPVASGGSAVTDEDTAVPVTMAATDADLPANALTYTVVTAPVHGSVGVVSGTQVTYTPDTNYNGPDSFTFTANDGLADSAPESVNITVRPVNDEPVANAGADQNVSTRDDVFLDGSGSWDVDTDPLTYSWTLISIPAHSKAVLSGETTAHPSFKADKEGAYVMSLVVHDGTAGSAPSTVTVTASKQKKK